MNYLFMPLMTIMGLGYAPFFPGTLASFIGMIVWWFIPNIFFIQVSLIALVILISILLLKNNELESKDPSYIVIDELIGIWISLLMVPKEVDFFLIGFFIFRFFDIFKPSIIYNIQFINYPYDIIMDDIVAAIFTLIIIASMILL